MILPGFPIMPPTAAPLLLAGSFEDSFDGWTAASAERASGGLPARTGATYVQPTGYDAEDAQYSGAITYVVPFAQHFGRTLEFSIWHRTGGGFAGVYVSINGEAATSFTSSNVYQQATVTIAARAGASHTIEVGMLSTGVLAIDDWQIRSLA